MRDMLNVDIHRVPLLAGLNYRLNRQRKLHKALKWMVATPSTASSFQGQGESLSQPCAKAEVEVVP